MYLGVTTVHIIFLFGCTYLLNLSISCVNTVFMDSLYSTGYFLPAASRSKSLGS